MCIWRKYPCINALIDVSEMFLKKTCDLRMQSSTWSHYKHHNTAKFFVACTSNGAICYISPIYAGCISDVKLTQISGFLTRLTDKPGISIMTNRGFTIRDMLHELGIELNIPPFMDGCMQLPASEIQERRSIASLRIQVERTIGRIKTFEVCKGTIPLSLSRLCNQIICACAFLCNFKPALVPPSSTDMRESDVDDYFEEFYSESDSCSD